MFLAKVVGNVWATQKSRHLDGQKLLLVKKLRGVPPVEASEILMAVSPTIDAGPGDYVLILDEGGSARMILNNKKAPIRTIIVGIVDQIQMHGEVYYFAGMKPRKGDCGERA